jgi:hypothetical protein
MPSAVGSFWDHIHGLRRHRHDHPYGCSSGRSPRPARRADTLRALAHHFPRFAWSWWARLCGRAARREALLDLRYHRSPFLARDPATHSTGRSDQPPCGRMTLRPVGPDPAAAWRTVWAPVCPDTLIRHPHPFAGCAGPVGPIWCSPLDHIGGI